MSRLSRLGLAATLAASVLAIGPASALADNASHSYLLVAEAANIGVAANGETIEITCETGEHVCGTFSDHPKSIEASGEFAHFLADGSLWATGTWTATS
jgi:hypothetical protein